MATIALFLLYHLLSFRGRIGRLKFVAIELLVLWPLVLTILITERVKLPDPVEFLAYTAAVLYWLFGYLGAATRRLHDLGRSGGYSLFANLAWPLLAMAPGDKEENQYGPPPRFQPAWGLALLILPLLISSYWLRDYLNPPDKTLVTHDLTEQGIYTYHVGEAWGGIGRSNCCVRINGQQLEIRWSMSTPRERGSPQQPQEEYRLTVANPPRQPEETYLHVYFLPDDQVRLGWSANWTSPLEGELAALYHPVGPGED